MARATHSIYSYRINDFSTPSGWSTSSLFDTSYIESTKSPIDTFYDKLSELNVLILDPRKFRPLIDQMNNDGRLPASAYIDLNNAITDTASVPPVLANLILLGYISAVESFFREMIRRIINLDPDSRKACELKSIAYGATLFHTPEMLPEALLENISFINKENIKEVLKDFVGIKMIPFSSSMNDVLLEYENVCQLRHCIVHRFGKLGANNAIKLGLDSHGSFIEKPIVLKYASLQVVGVVCANLAKEVNQFLWEYIMMRLIAEPVNSQTWKKRSAPCKWSWDFRRDKKAFKNYFDTFALTNTGSHTANLSDAYREYKTKYFSLP